MQNKDSMTDLMDKYVKYMRQKRYSIKTIEQYCSYINRLFEVESRIYRITNDQVQDFLLKAESESGQNCRISAIQLFFKVNFPKRRFNVFIRPRKSKKLIEILTVNEVWNIINSIQHIKQKAIISGIYLHGLRRSEILNLKYSDIDRKRNLLHVRESKGRKDRFVPLNEIWLKYLTVYAKSENHKKGYELPIFQPYSETSIYNIVKAKAKECQIIKNVYPHLLRDCYASHLLQQGIDTRFIQEILGHEKLETTQKYLHIAATDISKIALKIA